MQDPESSHPGRRLSAAARLSAGDKTMGTGPRPKGESMEALTSALDADSEIHMEKLLAICLALPRRQVKSAIEETCREHPDLAPHLHHRYLSLLQMGILEHHEEDQEDQPGEMAW